MLYVFFYMLGVAPPPLGRLGTGITPPAAITGLYVVDALLTGNWRRWPPRSTSSCCRRSTLGFSVMAPIARMVRSTMLEILESDYIKAAWAAGIPRRSVVYGDALRQLHDPGRSPCSAWSSAS